jgi:NADH dehydrogenase
MTVMVTGASGLIGRALVPMLVRKDEVRACVRRPDAADPLRALGAKVAVGRLDDADALAEIMKRVYSVIHLVGGPNHPDDDAVFAANHGSVMTALAAAREAKVRRFILVSAAGAAIDASNPYLRAKGLAEEAVAQSGLDHAIVRSTHAYGLGGLWFAATVEGATATPPFTVGDGASSIAPVFADDLAAVLAEADDREGAVEGTWAIEGPDATSTSELVALLAPEAAAPPVARAPAEASIALGVALGVPFSRTAAELFALPSRADAPDAATVFGVRRTPLVEGLHATMERAAAVGR